MQTAHTYSLYDRLMALPDGLTGEILNGQLHTHPRPSFPHGQTETMLAAALALPFHRGKGGPGGWWIIIEPEVHFVRDQEVCVPDLAGWRRTRLPTPPQGHKLEVAPDWICEILSPSTESKDRQIKMAIYARYGVPHAWLIDPIKRSLEIYGLDGGEWSLLGVHDGDRNVAAPPFEAVTLELDALWC